MELIPTQDEVVALLRSTGGLRKGHFEYPSGMHISEYLQVALTMRDFNVSNILCVALSRLLRSNSDIRALLPNVSIVAPATGGLPVAYGVGEALRARKVYWAERDNADEPLQFRQHLELEKGEKVILVDDIFRTGAKLTELKNLVEADGGKVIALAVIVSQPSPGKQPFEGMPFYCLAHLKPTDVDPYSCEQCKASEPLERVRQ